jgi:hypothetical protein
LQIYLYFAFRQGDKKAKFRLDIGELLTLGTLLKIMYLQKYPNFWLFPSARRYASISTKNGFGYIYSQTHLITQLFGELSSSLSVFATFAQKDFVKVDQNLYQAVSARQLNVHFRCIFQTLKLD